MDIDRERERGREGERKRSREGEIERGREGERESSFALAVMNTLHVPDTSQGVLSSLGSRRKAEPERGGTGESDKVREGELDSGREPEQRGCLF